MNSSPESIKEKKEFSPRSFMLVASVFSILCTIVMITLIQADFLKASVIFSFEKPAKQAVIIGVAISFLVLYGIAAARLMPSSEIDDTNKMYQTYSLGTILSFMAAGALFEELLLRGVIQTLAMHYFNNYWLAIITATLLFLLMHTQYFIKPAMLINVALASVLFGIVYFETNNILAAFFVHFSTNVITTVLFKYRIIKLRD